MNAKVVADITFHSAASHARAINDAQKIIVVEIDGRLVALTPIDDHVQVAFDFDIDNCEILKDFNIPDTLVRQAIAAAEIQSILFGQVKNYI